MKKYIFMILACIGFITATQAQRKIPTTGVLTGLSATYGKITDTITDATAHYMVIDAVPAAMTITAVATFVEITGTTSGTATIEVGYTNAAGTTQWVTPNLLRSTTAQPSYTITDTGTQLTSWRLENFDGDKIRVKIVGGSTVQFTAALIAKGYADK